MEPEVLHQYEVRMEELKTRADEMQVAHPFIFVVIDSVLHITKKIDNMKQSLKLKNK
jgi:hypothetical protein